MNGFVPASGLKSPDATGRPKGRTTRPKPMYALHENSETTPEYMKVAKDLMKTYGTSELPSGLQPRWMRNRINKNISKGMTKGN
jgi:hypothetical protein